MESLLIRAPGLLDQMRRRVHFWVRGHPTPAVCWSDASIRRRWRELVLTAREDEVTCALCIAWMKRNDR